MSAKFSAGGDISFYEDTGTTAKLFWDASAESLGIGTSAPSTGLEVATTNYTFAGTTYDIYGLFGDTSGGLRLGADSSNDDSVIGTTGTNNLQFVTYNGSAWDSRMTLTNTGNVGIGTSSPVDLLHVHEASAGVARMRLSNTEGYLEIGTNNQVMNLDSQTHTFRNEAGSSEYMRIDSAGRVGIGTSSPTTSLDLASTNFGLPPTSGTTPNAFMRVGYTDRTWTGSEMLFGILNAHPNYAGFVQMKKPTDYSTNRAFLINPQGGNVGIGVTNPSDYYAENLVVAAADEGGITIECGATEKAYLMFADGTSGSAAYRSYLGYDHALDSLNVVSSNYINFYTGDPASERMRIDSAGNLLVSTTGIPTTGGFRFDAGSDSILRIGHASGVSSGSNYLLFYYGASIIGSITQNGNSQVLYNISSDQRLKENIVDAPSASDDIDAIQVRSFDWKVDGSHQKYGMVAQELQAVAPEAVSVPEDSEDMMGVDYSKLVPMLIKEIQSLRNRVAQLEE